MRILLLLCFSFLIAASSFAQEVDAPPPNTPPPAGYKDTGTATLFGVLITGGGHFYAGEAGKGALLLGVGVGAFVVGAALSTNEITCNGFSCSESVSATPLLIGAGVALGAWIYGIVDAPNAARRSNARNGYATTTVSPYVYPDGGGIAVSMRF